MGAGDYLLTATLKIDLIGAFDEQDRALGMAAVRRLIEVLRAEYPGVTVVYPPGAAGEAPPNRGLGRYVDQLEQAPTDNGTLV